MGITADVAVARLLHDEGEEILGPEAVKFLVGLHRRFDRRWHSMLAARAQRDAALRAGWDLDFLPETRSLRDDEWTVAPAREDYSDRRVELVGPTDRRTIVEGLSSGACGFVADFDEALSPTWRNVVDGHRNVIDAVDGTISYQDGGETRAVGPDAATLLVRPRGWHLRESHIRVAGEPMAAALVDVGLYVFHCAERLADRGSAVYLYLPKIEHHHEARLWNDVFCWSQRMLGLPPGTIRATVLIETLPAAFQMDEILWQLGDHAYGLNAGRWDYLFSTIKCFRERPEFVLPHRDEVTMSAPFMRAYAELLVDTCHRRGTFAIGGMTAIEASRLATSVDEQVIDVVRADKRREAADGFDGTWVARPDLVAAALREFEGPRPTGRHDAPHGPRIPVTAADLLDVGRPAGAISESALRANVRAGYRYISAWLTGRGVAAIDNLPEEAAGAELSRAQIWQWVRHGSTLLDGRMVTRELVLAILEEEMAGMEADMEPDEWARARPDETRDIFERVALSDHFPAFLTLPAYEALY